MAENTNAGTPAGTETARPAAVGEAGFTPHPHAEDAELAALEQAANSGEQPTEQPSAEPAPAAAAPAAEPAAEPEAEPTEPDGEQPRGKDGKWIPKARFDEQVQREREKAEALAAAAYWKGQAEALKAGGVKPAGEAPPTPEQETAALEAAILQKATDFDEGRIGMAEFKRFERQATQRIDALRAPAVPAAAPADMRLQELTMALPERFPIIQRLTAAHVTALQPLAEMELASEGVALGGDPRSSYLIRERIAQLAQARWGNAPQPPASTTRQPNVKAAQDKLALAARMPPTLTKTGTAQVPQDRYSLEAVSKMDLDELATAVPDSVLRQLTGQ
jgi:hypothetical protein